jgi:hypothetical protein
MRKFSVFLLAGFLVLAGFLSPQTSKAQTVVDLELLLLVDVSGSITEDEYNLQKTGYINAFDNSDIHDAIEALDNGIAVAYAEWSGASQQALLVDWTFLGTGSDSEDFADDIFLTDRAFTGSSNRTAPGSAINWASPSGIDLFDNDFEGPNVIDISGDGTQNDGDNTFDAATAANAAGIQINGLPIGSESLQNWYLNNIVTPGGGFLVAASSFDDFESAVLEKLQKEIAGVPEPATLLLLGSGLIGLAGYGRKKFLKK